MSDFMSTGGYFGKKSNIDKQMGDSMSFKYLLAGLY